MTKGECPEKIATTAVKKFQKMYNCCQAVACSVCEKYGISEQDMFRLTEAFGSGIGGLNDTCGAAMGMFLIISLAGSAGDMEQPMLTKFDTYDRIKEAARKFEEKCGSIYCRDLKTQEGTQPLPCCTSCVEAGAQILEEMLKKMS